MNPSCPRQKYLMGPGGYGGQRFAHDLGAPSTSHKVHGAAIYGNMDPINVPQMLAYIPAPWILWVLGFIKRVLSLFNSLSVGSRRTTTREIQLGFQWMAMLNGANWLSIINITLEGLPFGVLSGHITMEQKKLPMC